MSLYQLVPDAESLLDLEPEELAGVVLQYLNSCGQDSGQLNRYNFTLPHTVEQYSRQYHDRLKAALMEAWIWLEREGLLAPRPGDMGGHWVFITRRGSRLRTAEDVAAYRRANLLPRQLLHPIIAQKIWAAFLRGDYDAAVFQAFKEVEVAVRAAVSYPPEIVGTDLMRKAFDSRSGLLRDPESPPAEREALAHLFAGSIGSYKNPHSHRHVRIDAEEAVEMIMLASHLLKIVDSRREKGKAVNPAAQPDGSAAG